MQVIRPTRTDRINAVAKLRVYLDNCCFNRPYDDQSHLVIRLETEAKIQIQNSTKSGEIELV
jgi:hypothetical protein